MSCSHDASVTGPCSRGGFLLCGCMLVVFPPVWKGPEHQAFSVRVCRQRLCQPAWYAAASGLLRLPGWNLKALSATHWKPWSSMASRSSGALILAPPRQTLADLKGFCSTARPSFQEMRALLDVTLARKRTPSRADLRSGEFKHQRAECFLKLLRKS